jgi:hypothetical protein
MPVDPELVAKVRDAEREKSSCLDDPADAETRDLRLAIGVWLAAATLMCGMITATIALIESGR